MTLIAGSPVIILFETLEFMYESKLLLLDDFNISEFLNHLNRKCYSGIVDVLCNFVIL